MAAARPLRVEVTVEGFGYGAQARCFSIAPDAPGSLPYPKRSASDATSVAGGDRGAVSVLLRGEQGRWCRKGEAMSLRSMRKGARLAASDTHASGADWASRAARSDRCPRSSCGRKTKIIIVSRYAERLLVAQRMSTGPGGDCETPFFLDSDVDVTESRPISLFRALSEVDRARCRS